jgi:hypothetical protein
VMSCDSYRPMNSNVRFFDFEYFMNTRDNYRHLKMVQADLFGMEITDD